jgi:hypothetical protein
VDLISRLRVQWDRVLAGAALLLGVVLLVLGWRGVADHALTAQQLPYVVSGGLGAVFVLAVGATLWISADLRDEWRKLDALHDDVKLLRAELQQQAGSAGLASTGELEELSLAALVDTTGLPSSNGASKRKHRVAPPR